MLEELCKRIQHCGATLRRPRNGFVGSKVWPVSNFAQQLATNNLQRASNNIHQHACNRVCKRKQRTLLHVTWNNVASVRKRFKGFKNWEFRRRDSLTDWKLELLNSLFPEFYARFDQFCPVTFNSTPCDTHFPSKSLVWELFQVTSCSLFT